MFSKNNLVIKILICKVNNDPKLVHKYDFTYKSQKYSLTDILKEILYVLQTGIPWRALRSPINWNTVYKHYICLCKFDIFRLSYKDLLTKYIKNNRGKLKFIYTDTSIIPNKYGQDKACLNKYYKNKRVTKLSLITLYSFNIYL